MKQILFVCSMIIAIMTTSLLTASSFDPQQGKKVVTPSKVQKDVYTCPMHPEIVKDKAGTCPKCGMDLVKKDVKAVVYTCPMHPEVKQEKMGTCPKCGMDLVKKEADKK